eukprot:532135-Hanusia_phi.AAC.1
MSLSGTTRPVILPLSFALSSTEFIDAYTYRIAILYSGCLSLISLNTLCSLLRNLHAQPALLVCQTPSGGGISLDVSLPLWEPLSEGVWVDLHDVWQREQALVRHPVDCSALPRSHRPCRVHNPGVLSVGCTAAYHVMDEDVLQQLAGLHVVPVPGKVPRAADVTEGPPDLGAFLVVVAAGGKREVVGGRDLEVEGGQLLPGLPDAEELAVAMRVGKRTMGAGYSLLSCRPCHGLPEEAQRQGKVDGAKA